MWSPTRRTTRRNADGSREGRREGRDDLIWTFISSCLSARQTRATKQFRLRTGKYLNPLSALSAAHRSWNCGNHLGPISRWEKHHTSFWLATTTRLEDRELWLTSRTSTPNTGKSALTGFSKSVSTVVLPWGIIAIDRKQKLISSYQSSGRTEKMVWLY